MKFEDLKKVNATLKTMKIETKKGKAKDYVPVNERELAFWQLHPNGRIEPEILQLEPDYCVFKVTLYDENDRPIASGHAREEKESSFINKQSFLENCETSALGRALGIAGIGIDVSIASADEMETIVNNQERIRVENEPIGEVKARAFRKRMAIEGLIEEFILGSCGINSIEELTEGKHKWICDHMKEVKEQQNRWSARAD